MMVLEQPQQAPHLKGSSEKLSEQEAALERRANASNDAEKIRSILGWVQNVSSEDPAMDKQELEGLTKHIVEETYRDTEEALEGRIKHYLAMIDDDLAQEAKLAEADKSNIFKRIFLDPDRRRFRTDSMGRKTPTLAEKTLQEQKVVLNELYNVRAELRRLKNGASSAIVKLDGLRSLRERLGIAALPRTVVDDYDTFDAMKRRASEVRDRSLEVNWSGLEMQFQELQKGFDTAESVIQMMDSGGELAAGFILPGYGDKFYALCRELTHVSTGYKTPEQAGKDLAFSIAASYLGGKIADKVKLGPTIAKYSELLTKKLSKEFAKKAVEALTKLSVQAGEGALRGALSGGLEKAMHGISKGKDPETILSESLVAAKSGAIIGAFMGPICGFIQHRIDLRNQHGAVSHTPVPAPSVEDILKIPDTPEGKMLRIALAQEMLDLPSGISPQQAQAVITAHEVPMSGEKYSLPNLRRKMDILMGAGFSKDQADALLRMGICGKKPQVPGAGSPTENGSSQGPQQTPDSAISSPSLRFGSVTIDSSAPVGTKIIASGVDPTWTSRKNPTSLAKTSNGKFYQSIAVSSTQDATITFDAHPSSVVSHVSPDGNVTVTEYTFQGKPSEFYLTRRSVPLASVAPAPVTPAPTKPTPVQASAPNSGPPPPPPPPSKAPARQPSPQPTTSSPPAKPQSSPFVQTVGPKPPPPPRSKNTPSSAPVQPAPPSETPPKQPISTSQSPSQAPKTAPQKPLAAQPAPPLRSRAGPRRPLVGRVPDVQDLPLTRDASRFTPHEQSVIARYRALTENPQKLYEWTAKYGHLSPEQAAMTPELQQTLRKLRERGVFTFKSYIHNLSDRGDKVFDGAFGHAELPFIVQGIPQRKLSRGKGADVESPVAKGGLFDKSIPQRERLILRPVLGSQGPNYSSVGYHEMVPGSGTQESAWTLTYSFIDAHQYRGGEYDFTPKVRKGDQSLAIKARDTSGPGKNTDHSFLQDVDHDHKMSAVLDAGRARPDIGRSNELGVTITLPESEARALAAFFRANPHMIRPFFINGMQGMEFTHIPPPYQETDALPSPGILFREMKMPERPVYRDQHLEHHDEVLH